MSNAKSCAPLVALGKRLRGCPLLHTLGVRPNFSDYSAEEKRLILEAPKIYYPTPLYAELFDIMGKKTFPSYHTYKVAQDKIKQTALFSLTGLPHPKTRVFFGRRQKSSILDYFQFPFIGKKPRGSALGRDVYLIRDKEDLQRYCQNDWPAYIQEYLPIKRDIRAVVIGGKVRLAYWRVAQDDEFRTNVHAGGQIDLSPIPQAAIRLAEQVAIQCRWDDVGIDILNDKGKFYIIEANMKYGLQGFSAAGIDYVELMTQLIQCGDI